MEKKGFYSNLTLEEKSTCYYYKSSSLSRLGQPEEAFTIATQALREVERSKMQKLAVKIILAQLRALYYMKRLVDASDVILKGEKIIDSLSLIERNSESFWIAQFNDVSAYIYRLKGDFEKAVKYYKANITLGELTNNSSFVLDSLLRLGEVDYMQGELDSALEYFQQSLSQTETSEEEEHLADSLLGIGLIHSARGNLNEALEYYQRSLSVNQSLDRSHDVGLLFNEIGLIYRAKGQLEPALNYLKLSLESFDPTEVCMCKSDAMFSQILLYLESKDLPQAQRLLKDLNSLQEDNPTKYNTLQSQLAQALIFKESQRMKDKVLAQDLLKSIVEEEVLYFKYTALAMMHLCELLLIEFKSFGDFVVLEEVNGLIKQINQLGSQGGSYPLIVESLILQAKLLIVDGKLDEALKILEKAQIMTKENHLGLLGQVVNEEKETLENEYTRWQNLIEDNVSIKELVKQVQIEDYLRMAQRMVNIRSHED